MKPRQERSLSITGLATFVRLPFPLPWLRRNYLMALALSKSCLAAAETIQGYRNGTWQIDTETGKWKQKR